VVKRTEVIKKIEKYLKMMGITKKRTFSLSPKIFLFLTPLTNR
jgi:hypothetical protein